ncbi:MAG: TlpA family protein disulfide reductase [Rhodospirillaceae bacterium]|nr:TlpA family protein disulfide reductase [Rhodospirillaceae bacterium]
MSQSRLIVLAVVLAAVLITAITLLASKPEPVASAAPPEVKKVPIEAASTPPSAPPAEEVNAIEWHQIPVPGPLETVFQDSANADVTLKSLFDTSFKGKVVVVNFWATWCAPCVKEMPTLDALQTQMGGDKLQVIAISQDRDGAKVTAPFIEKNGWKKVSFYTEPKARFARDAQIRGLPTTIILNLKGEEVGRLEGTIDWTRADVKEALTRLMGG